MGRSKKTYYPIVMCGAYFPLDFLMELKRAVLEEVSESVDLVQFISEMIQSFDFSEIPYLKNMMMIKTENIVMYEEDEFDPGFFIGIDFLDVPDHVSKKRACIDVRNVFEKVGFLDGEDANESVQVFARCISGKS